MKFTKSDNALASILDAIWSNESANYLTNKRRIIIIIALIQSITFNYEISNKNHNFVPISIIHECARYIAYWAKKC